MNIQSPPDPKWHWRNTRSIGFGFEFWVWPWCFGAGRDDDVWGGHRWLCVGPLTFVLKYSIGNVSADLPERLFALSEGEAYVRAYKAEEKRSASK